MGSVFIDPHHKNFNNPHVGHMFHWKLGIPLDPIDDHILVSEYISSTARDRVSLDRSTSGFRASVPYYHGLYSTH